MLKLTGARLEKIVNIDMYLSTENRLRGEISYISKRYSEANKNTWTIMALKTVKTYLDMNNLYDWAMNGYLPYGGFKWLKNIDQSVKIIR